MGSLSILHIDKKLGLGGTSKNIEILARELNSRDGIKCKVASWEEGERAERLKREGIEVVNLDDEVEIEKLIEEEDLDIIHAHGGALEKVSLSVLKKAPFLVKTANFGWPDERLLDIVDLFLFPSKMTLLRYNVIDGRGSGKCQLLYHPIEFNELRTDRDLDVEGNPVIGKIGRAAEGKWADMTVESFDDLLGRRPDAKLLLLNAPSKIQDLIEEKGIEENVRLIEDIPLGDIDLFYNSIDVMAHSSAIGESFGYVIAESLVSGTPVVSRSTPMRDNAQVELIKNKKNGFIANNYSSYSKCLERAIDSDFENYFVENYDSGVVADRLLSKYTDLMNRELIEDLERYAEKYEMSLNENEGESLDSILEKRIWQFLVILPWKNRFLYDVLRSFFQPGRKMYKLRKKII